MLKIDEVTNLGAARIRVRSLLSAMNMRREQNICAKPVPLDYHRTEFTKEMFEQGYTILAPQMSPIHFDVVEPVFSRHGYHVEILDNATRKAVDVGLQYVNNAACSPSILSVGQLLAALLSGDQHTFETFRCEAPELVHLPQATFVWFCRNYLDRDYPFRMLLRCNGVTFPDRKEA